MDLEEGIHNICLMHLSNFQEQSPLLKRQFSYITRKNSRLDAGSSLLLKEDNSSPTSTDDGKK